MIAENTDISGNNTVTQVNNKQLSKKKKTNKIKKNNPVTETAPITNTYPSYNIPPLTATSTPIKNITISGLDDKTSAYVINILSAIIGIFVFYGVPYLANELNRPITAAILNIVPNAMILSFFIVESEFKIYLEGCVFTPAFNVIDNIISYIFFVYFSWSATSTLALNIFLWLFVVAVSFLFNQ
jgi:hypothetical protein